VLPVLPVLPLDRHALTTARTVTAAAAVTEAASRVVREANISVLRRRATCR